MPSIVPDAAEDVPAIVTGDGGAGRMQHGDVTFTFSSSDDSSSELNTALSSLITNYQSSLVAIQGVEQDDHQAIYEVLAKDNDLVFDGMTLYNPKGKRIRIYAVSGACIGSTEDTSVATDYLPNGAYVVVSKDGCLKITK